MSQPGSVVTLPAPGPRCGFPSFSLRRALSSAIEGLASVIVVWRFSGASTLSRDFVTVA
jgi:hypothetical protein